MAPLPCVAIAAQSLSGLIFARRVAQALLPAARVRAPRGRGHTPSNLLEAAARRIYKSLQKTRRLAGASVRYSITMRRPASALLWLACASAAALAPASAQTTYSETVLYNFVAAPHGAYPYANVILDSAGTVYGTTDAGGAYDQGVVFKVDAAGHQTVLYSFTGRDDGGTPLAGVESDSQGNLYGTTFAGGAAGMGVVYKLDPAGNQTILHSFMGGTDGASPYAGVLLDSTGYIYGTTYYGGSASYGVVYKLDPAGNYTVLYSFTGGAAGGNPYAGVIRDEAGNLYGTTYVGGSAHCSYACGVVYKLDTAGHETVLHNFQGGSFDGKGPFAGVIRDSAGNLYGTTTRGGAAHAGVVFKLDAGGRETVLYAFTGGADGCFPNQGNLIRDAAGNLYGTTSGGTPYGLPDDPAVVYKLNAAGQETVLYTFMDGADGTQPQSGLTRDTAGNLYGTTFFGGVAGNGVVYKLDSAGQETVLYSFAGGVGHGAYGDPIRGAAGNFYGTTFQGGPADAGVVYELDAAGYYTMLYGFTGSSDGAGPMAGLIRDPAGNLYGTTYSGGAGAGVVYKLDTAGQETVLYSFTGGADGGYPSSGLIRDSAGNLYGTAPYGGAGGGVVYKVDPSGHETVLYSFTGGADGSGPFAGVTADSDGNLYGTTYNGGTNSGVVYKLDAALHETVLWTFNGATGAGPNAGVTRDSAGNLYGTTTYGGGPSNAGVVYKLDTAGNYTVLHAFTGGADGGVPYAGVILDSAGNIYGTTGGGGLAGACSSSNNYPSGCGVVFKLDSAGQETVLHTFTGFADGGVPLGGPIFDPAGNLYGTTGAGGSDTVGVVFKLTPR